MGTQTPDDIMPSRTTHGGARYPTTSMHGDECTCSKTVSCLNNNYCIHICLHCSSKHIHAKHGSSKYITPKNNVIRIVFVERKHPLAN